MIFLLPPRSDYEDLVLQEAQVRYELEEQKKRLAFELEKRDSEHEEQVQIMEQVIQKKELKAHMLRSRELGLMRWRSFRIQQLHVRAPAIIMLIR